MRIRSDSNNFTIVIGPFFHKSLEICWHKSVLGHGLEICWYFRTRRDHAGLRSFVNWGKRTLELNVCDDRHWNHEKDRYNLPGEESAIRAFEGYPHE